MALSLSLLFLLHGLLVRHISDLQTSEHSEHKEDSPLVHNESCIDHTQVFSRIQGDDHSTDFSYALITTNSLDFSLDGIWQDIAPLYISEIDSGQGLFLENKVLRL